MHSYLEDMHIPTYLRFACWASFSILILGPIIEKLVAPNNSLNLKQTTDEIIFLILIFN